MHNKPQTSHSATSGQFSCAQSQDKKQTILLNNIVYVRHTWHKADTQISVSTIREKSWYYFSTKIDKLKNKIWEHIVFFKKKIFFLKILLFWLS